MLTTFARVEIQSNSILVSAWLSSRIEKCYVNGVWSHEDTFIAHFYGALQEED